MADSVPELTAQTNNRQSSNRVSTKNKPISTKKSKLDRLDLEQNKSGGCCSSGGENGGGGC